MRAFTARGLTKLLLAGELKGTKSSLVTRFEWDVALLSLTPTLQCRHCTNSLFKLGKHKLGQLIDVWNEFALPSGPLVVGPLWLEEAGIVASSSDVLGLVLQ